MPVSRAMRRMLGLAFVLAVFGIWEGVTRAGLVDVMILRPGTEVLRAFVGNVLDGTYSHHALVTARRFGTGFLMAILVAVPFGVLVGALRRGADYVVPVVNFLYPIPVTALIPVAGAFFGLRHALYAFLVALASGIPIFLASLDAVRRIEPVLLETARTLGVRGRETFLKVLLPASLPGIATGIYVASGIGVIVAIATEMVASSAGLGWVVLHRQRTLRIADMYAAILAVATFGFVVVSAVGALAAAVTRWHTAAVSKRW